MDRTQEVIGIGGEYGGPDIPGWVLEQQIRLNQFLEKHCKQPYSREVTSMIFALRVEGRVKSFGFKGIDALRRDKARKTIRADISVRRREWDTNPEKYRKFLWDSVRMAIQASLERLKKDKIAVDELRLKRDLSKVQREFLGMN